MKKTILLISVFVGLLLTNLKAQSEKGDTAQKQVFRMVEQMPEFYFGEDSMSRFISNNLIYPIIAKQKGLQGKVIIQFVVNSDGTLSDYKILRDIGEGCGQAVVDVVRKMPKWKPGKQNGKFVNVYFVLPISFSLN
ncbi:MAG: hypothetical protein RJA07_877 [Bacteroidota bacterium]|jgi:protein TonB